MSDDDFLNEPARKLNEPIRQYQNGRAEHAFRLRMEGMTYREIGERLGVGGQRARDLAQKGLRIARVEERLRVVRRA